MWRQSISGCKTQRVVPALQCAVGITPADAAGGGISSGGDAALREDALGDGADLGGGVGDGGAGSAERVFLRLRRARLADDDGAGVAHAPPGRRAGSADKGD